MNWDLGRAVHFARLAHYGQVDKAGFDYFTAHVSAVANDVARAGYDEDHQIVAVLHDAIEDWPDGPVTGFVVLSQMEFPRELIEALNAITHRKNEAQERYLARVLDNRIATVVKRFDVAQNDDPERMALIRDAAARDRLTEKYRIARNRLGMPPRKEAVHS